MGVSNQSKTLQIYTQPNLIFKAQHIGIMGIKESFYQLKPIFQLI